MKCFYEGYCTLLSNEFRCTKKLEMGCWGVKIKLPCLAIKGEHAEKLVECRDRWINLVNTFS